MNFYGRIPVGFSGAISFSRELAGLGLSFIGLTVSNSGLFRAPGFIVSPVGEGAKKKKKEKIGKKKDGKRNTIGKKGRKEVWKEEGIKKKEEQIGRRREKKKKKSSAGFKLVRSVLLVFLSVKWDGVSGRIGFTFLPPEPHSLLLSGLLSSSSRSFCSPLGI